MPGNGVLRCKLPCLVPPEIPSNVAHRATDSAAVYSLDVGFTGRLPTPIRSNISTGLDGSDRDTYTGYAPSLARNPLSPVEAVYQPFLDTPRSLLSGPHLPISPGTAAGYCHSRMASTSGYGVGNTAAECLNFPWPELLCIVDMTCNGQAVTPDIHAKVEKGFFMAAAEQKWTCYRRNYFSVQGNFTLTPSIANGRLYIMRNGGSEQVQAMGMRLAAAVDGAMGKTVELVQHTPKRDAGPKTKIEITKVSPTAPTAAGWRGANSTISPHGVYAMPIAAFHPTGAVPGPHLPLQNTGEPDSPSMPSPPGSQYGYSAATASHVPLPGQTTMDNFERVQFKQATANNGKRRASQQYFHLIMELFADVRKEGSESPNWVKVAHRVSDKIVVRGRSPSHYQNEGQNGQVGRGGSASGGSGYSGASGGAYGGMNAGGFRSSTGNYVASVGGAAPAAGGYRGGKYYGPQASSDRSGSSPDSGDEGATDLEHPMESVMLDVERADLQQYEGYRYFPAPIYEGISQQTLPPLSKMDGAPGYGSDPRVYAVKAEYADAVPGAQWEQGGCGRFQGVETSRGYFPDLSANYS